MRFPMRSTALSADMFHRTQMKKETIITAAAYNALREAAIAKQRMPEFRKWLEGRKLVITK